MPLTLLEYAIDSETGDLPDFAFTAVVTPRPFFGYYYTDA
jgi:hypothetical protein